MKRIVLLLFVLCTLVYKTIDAQTMSTFRASYSGFGGVFSLPTNVVESQTANQYIVAGWDLPLGAPRGILFEVSSTGSPLWGKRYASATHNDVIKDGTTDYTVCGQWVGTLFSPQEDGYIAKLSSTGTKVFSRRVTTASGKPNFLKVKKVSDGGYIVAGTIRRLNQESVTNDSTSAFVAKFSSTGGFVWQRSFRFFKNSTLTTAIRNDASFVDCIEVSDGYIFVGRYEVDDVINVNSDGDDMTPDDAIILKTNTDGTIVYLKQIDAPSTSGTQTSKFFNWLSKTTTNEALISGTDYNGYPALLLRLPSSGGWVEPTWRRKYSFGGFLTAFEPSSIFQSTDGKYVISGLYINFLTFRQFLMKIEPSDYNLIWSKLYNGGLPVSPTAAQASDGGYFGASGVTSTQFFKSNTFGVIGNVGSCTESEFTVNHQDVTYTWSDPFYKSYNFTLTSSDITAAITTITVTNSIVCTQETPLPVEWNDFSIKQIENKAKINWSTASEQNAWKFELERSTNGEDWVYLETIEAVGNTSDISNYETIDYRPEDGYNYYRLKQIDFDGKFSFSDLRFLNFNKETVSKIYPNPTIGKINISNLNENELIEIYDISGKKLYETLKKNDMNELDLSYLNEGVYLVYINYTFTDKLVIQH